jgi:hypothetical protein
MVSELEVTVTSYDSRIAAMTTGHNSKVAAMVSELESTRTSHNAQTAALI